MYGGALIGLTLVVIFWAIEKLFVWARGEGPSLPPTSEQVERLIFRDMRHGWTAYVRRNKEIELATLVNEFVSSELRSIEFNIPELIRRVGPERVIQRIMDVIEKSGTHARADLRRVAQGGPSRLVETSGSGTTELLFRWASGAEPSSEQVEQWIFRDMGRAWRAYANQNKSIELATLVNAFVSSELRSIEYNLPRLIPRVGVERVIRRIMDAVEKSGTHARAELRRVTSQELSRLVETSGA